MVARIKACVERLSESKNPAGYKLARDDRAMQSQRWRRLFSEAGCTYWLTRFVILRLLGFIYAVAFLVAANQIVPLIGEHGLLPLHLFLERARDAFGSSLAAFLHLPSLFWIAHSD